MSSLGYHADDGKIFIGSGIGDPVVPRYHKGDMMGCGILFHTDYMCQYDRYMSTVQTAVCDFLITSRIVVLSCVHFKMHCTIRKIFCRIHSLHL